jgi:hypothetical protein
MPMSADSADRPRAAAFVARRRLRVLVLSGSLRRESLNTRLARLAARTIERNGGSVDLATLAEFDAPSYSQDAQDSAGIPDGPAQLRQRLEAADAFVIAAPEYNASDRLGITIPAAAISSAARHGHVGIAIHERR